MAVWRRVGSSEVEKIGGIDGESSMGPSSGGASTELLIAMVASSETWATDNLWAEEIEY